MTTTTRTAPLRELAQFLPPLVLLAALAETATHFGTRHDELLKAFIVVALAQVLPGALVWRLVRPVEGWLLEDVAFGLAVGAALGVPTHLLSTALGVSAVDALVPALVVVGLLAVPATRTRILTREIRPLPWAWASVATASCLVAVLAVLVTFREPVRWKGWARLYVDTPYHIALDAEMLHRFPPHYPQLAGEALNYHWFSYAWAGQVATLSGTGVDILFLRFNPLLLVVAVPLVTAFAALRVTRSAWAGAGAAVCAFLLEGLAPWAVALTSSTPLHSPLSPTQQFGLLTFLPLVGLIAMRWRGEVSARGSLGLLVLLLVVSGGSKGSTLPVLVAGALLASFIVLVTRRGPRWTIWGDTVLAIAVLLVLQRTIFGGGSGNIRLATPDLMLESRGRPLADGPFDVTSGYGLAVSGLVVVSLALGYSACVGILASRTLRRDFAAWLLLGIGISGFCAITLLQHPGQSQYYFFFTAAVPLGILVAWGIAALLEHAEQPARWLLAGGTVGIASLAVTHLLLAVPSDEPVSMPRAWTATALFLALVAGGGVLAGRRLRHRHEGPALGRAGVVVLIGLTAAGLVPSAEALVAWDAPPDRVAAEHSAGAVHHSEVRALRWLRDHSDPDDVVITNVHCLGAIRPTCDHRRFVVAAYSERAVLIEGWSYTRGAADHYDPDGELSYPRIPFWDPELLALNDGFIAGPTADAARELHDRGVRWVVAYSRAPRSADLEQYADLRRESDILRIYELKAPE